MQTSPALGQGTYVRANTGDDVNSHEHVVFWNDAALNPSKSDVAGRPIFDDIEMYELRFPGNNLTIITERVTDVQRQRWPRQYEAFKKSGSFAVGVSGTPLEQWPFVSRAQIAELKALNILTVEMLEQVDDNGIARIGTGARKLVECARAWLAEARDGAATMQLAAENAALKDQVAEQNGKINELIAMVQGVTAQLAQINAAGAQGVGPAALVGLSGALPATATTLAPQPASSIDSGAGPEFKPRAKVGRPSNAEKAAREAADAA